MTPEAVTKNRVKKLLEAEGVYYFMPVSNGMGVMGIFDVVCCVHGVFLGIECKATAKQKPTHLQTRNAHRAQAAGGIVFLVHAANIKDLEYTINQIKKGKHGTNALSVWPFDGAKEDE
jgi:hypothetical protein